MLIQTDDVISSPLGPIHLPMSDWFEAEWQYTVPASWAVFDSVAVLLGSSLSLKITSPIPVKDNVECNDKTH